MAYLTYETERTKNIEHYGTLAMIKKKTAKKDNRDPSPGNLLFANLFGEHSHEESLELLATGISASWHNANRLVSNAALLAKEGCLSSARFLITTAREELAKSYLLVDTCRLDFKKHKTVLHMMCKAFYSHIDKHAYIELLEIDRPLIDSMTKAKGLWDVAVQRWWPGNCEYPDMPHDTYFDRQAPIYVDYGEHERCWLVPEDANQVAYFILHDRISNTKKLVDLWRKADSDGLCSSHVLAIINSIFKSQYFNESTDIKELELIYKKIAQLVEECNIPIESFWASPLVRIPCYHFVLSHK